MKKKKKKKKNRNTKVQYPPHYRPKWPKWDEEERQEGLAIIVLSYGGLNDRKNVRVGNGIYTIYTGTTAN
jgi:hypothetical protein